MEGRRELRGRQAASQVLGATIPAPVSRDGRLLGAGIGGGELFLRAGRSAIEEILMGEFFFVLFFSSPISCRLSVFRSHWIGLDKF